jgi:hypothetical protein
MIDVHVSTLLCLVLVIFNKCSRTCVLDLSTHTMRSVLNPLTEHLSCQLCHEGLQNRIKDVIVQWTNVRVSGLDIRERRRRD